VTDRLQASGVRAISPIVDITNYVLLETGQPMHAFDLERLEGPEIRVRRAVAGETIVTIDGVARALDPEILVIADARRPQAVAGVMGGSDAEMSPATRRVMFESAYFKPASIRRTSKRLGLKTEASYRFERGADIDAAAHAIHRAVALMRQIGAGVPAGPVIDCYPVPREPNRIRLRRSRLASLLGMDVPDAEVERILRSLGLEVRAVTSGWEVVAPSFRVDLAREADLIEEVGRHHGYDKLEPRFPPVVAPAPPPDLRIARDRSLRRLLTAAGLSEAVTFGFIEAKAAHAFAAPAARGGLIPLANPLSGKFDTLRPSLLPGLVDAVAHNRRHGRHDVGLFEIGACFTTAEGETQALGIAWTGARLPEHWSGGNREVDFFDVKGVLEAVAEPLGVTIAFEPAASPFLVPGQAADVVANGSHVGVAGLLAPAIAQERDVPRQDRIFVAEIGLDRLWAVRGAPAEHVRPLPRFPFVVRDLSIVVSDALPAEIIRGTIQSAARSGRVPLVALRFFDRYKGQGLADDAVSLSVRLTFQAPDRTLTDADVQESFDAILAALVREHDARQR
jgi:phenylalanyl-tRNA synthetase beta chain